MKRVALLALLSFAGGCAGVKAEAKAQGVSEAQMIMSDIAKDAVADAPCAAALIPTIAAVYGGDWAALITEGSCIASAVKLIMDQVKGGAMAPSTGSLQKAATAKSLVKAVKAVQ